MLEVNEMVYEVLAQSMSVLDWVGSYRCGITICRIPSLKNTNRLLGLAFSKPCLDCEHKGKLSGISRGSLGLAEQQLGLDTLWGRVPAACHSGQWGWDQALGTLHFPSRASRQSLLSPGSGLSDQMRTENMVVCLYW